MLVFSQTLQML